MDRRLRVVLVIGCSLPLLSVLADLMAHNLGANPSQAINLRLGEWSLRFLCLTLAITPLQLACGWPGLSCCRPLFGWCTLGYASAHCLAYLAVDHVFVWPTITADIAESRYLWFGCLAYLVIVALALSSLRPVKKRLGKRWKTLHQWIYLAAAAAIVHYAWQLKGNLAKPLLYAAIVLILAAFKLLPLIARRRPSVIKKVT